MFNIFGSLAQFERTQAGLRAARERGTQGGRRPVVTPDKLRKAHAHRRRPDGARGGCAAEDRQDRALQGAGRCGRTVLRRNGKDRRMTGERNPNIVTSGLSGIVTEQGITVEVHIIRLENEPGWTLEVVNHSRISTV